MQLFVCLAAFSRRNRLQLNDQEYELFDQIFKIQIHLLPAGVRDLTEETVRIEHRVQLLGQQQVQLGALLACDRVGAERELVVQDLRVGHRDVHHGVQVRRAVEAAGQALGEVEEIGLLEQTLAYRADVQLEEHIPQRVLGTVEADQSAEDVHQSMRRYVRQSVDESVGDLVFDLLVLVDQAWYDAIQRIVHQLHLVLSVEVHHVRADVGEDQHEVVEDLLFEVRRDQIENGQDGCL